MSRFGQYCWKCQHRFSGKRCPVCGLEIVSKTIEKELPRLQKISETLRELRNEYQDLLCEQADLEQQLAAKQFGEKNRRHSA